MGYLEGFVAAVPAANKDVYAKHVADVAPLFKEFGATRMVETWGDDVPDGKLTDFRRAVKAKDDEVVVFSWIEYPDKATRDAANQKIMTDPRMKDFGAEMPFDGMRMIFAGFSPIVDLNGGGRSGYVDGTVLPVPMGGKEAYRDWATEAAGIMREYGATRVVDAWGDDVPDGKVTDYRGAVQAAVDEAVVYGWVEWPSKDVRDQAWGRMMTDQRLAPKDGALPKDGMKRMIMGGFSPIYDA